MELIKVNGIKANIVVLASYLMIMVPLTRDFGSWE